MHTDPSCQMVVVDKLYKELRQEVSKLKSGLQETKEEVIILKEEKAELEEQLSKRLPDILPASMNKKSNEMDMNILDIDVKQRKEDKME